MSLPLFLHYFVCPSTAVAAPSSALAAAAAAALLVGLTLAPPSSPAATSLVPAAPLVSSALSAELNWDHQFDF